MKKRSLKIFWHLSIGCICVLLGVTAQKWMRSRAFFSPSAHGQENATERFRRDGLSPAAQTLAGWSIGWPIGWPRGWPEGWHGDWHGDWSVKSIPGAGGAQDPGSLSRRAISWAELRSTASPTVKRANLLTQLDFYPSATSGPAAPLKLSSRAEIKNCFPDIDLSQINSLDDFKNQFVQDSFSTELLWQNRRFRLPNGEERRVRLYYKERQADPNAEPEYHVQIFQIDQDGLPVKMNVPLEQETNPHAPFVERAINGAEEFYEGHEIRYRKDGDGKNGVVASIRSENNHVTTFEYSDENGFLRCLAENNSQATSESSCLCRRINNLQ